MKKIIEAGVLVRRPIRRFLLSEGIDFKEDKGWLDSTFYLNCSDEKYRWIMKVLHKWQSNNFPPLNQYK